MQALFGLTSALLRCSLAFFRSRNEQAIIELTLRQQLATYAQTRSKPELTPLDRAFWVALFRFWPRWKDTLAIVKPDTVVRWHRKGFRLYWRSISKRGPGRPPISEEVQALIRRLAGENGWLALSPEESSRSRKATAMDDLPSQSQGRHRCDGLLSRPDSWISPLVCLVHY
jgi:hypothetical protein